MDDKIKCAIYARVSTDQQGDSIENQIGQAREYISRLGQLYDIEDIIVYKDEAVSGYYTSVFERAAMKQAIQDAKNKKFKLLVFKEVSRVGRDKQENPAIIGMFEQYGVRIIALNDNYDSLNKDNITFDILSVLSEQESKKISSRVSSAKKQKARRGQWNGEPPIGYVVNTETKKLEHDEETKDIPQLIFGLYVNSGLGTFKIAEHLNNKGMTTRQGFMWTREAVNRIIRNPAYIGNVVYGMKRNTLQREYDDDGRMSKKQVKIKIDKREWTVIEDAHEHLIDKELFYKAQMILADRGHQRKPRRAYHPLTGILYCGKCGQGMVCQKRSYKNKDYRYYICKTYHKYGRDKCNQANINANDLEKDVVGVVKAKLSNLPHDMIDAFANSEKDLVKIESDLKSKIKVRERIQKDQKDLFSQRDLFTDDAYRGQMIDLKKQMEFIDEEVGIIEKQKELLIEQIHNSTSFGYIVEEFMGINYEDTEVGKLKTLLHELVESIVFTENHFDLKLNYV